LLGLFFFIDVGASICGWGDLDLPTISHKPSYLTLQRTSHRPLGSVLLRGEINVYGMFTRRDKQ